jgi:hypothetical protein
VEKAGERSAIALVARKRHPLHERVNKAEAVLHEMGQGGKSTRESELQRGRYRNSDTARI